MRQQEYASELDKQIQEKRRAKEEEDRYRKEFDSSAFPFNNNSSSLYYPHNRIYRSSKDLRVNDWDRRRLDSQVASPPAVSRLSPLSFAPQQRVASDNRQKYARTGMEAPLPPHNSSSSYRLAPLSPLSQPPLYGADSVMRERSRIRGGGGEPMTDEDGNVISNLRHLHRTYDDEPVRTDSGAEQHYALSATYPAVQPAYVDSYYAPAAEHARYRSPAGAPSQRLPPLNVAPPSLTPSGILLADAAERAAHAQRRQERYQAELRAQIAAKQQRLAEEAALKEAEERAEEERIQRERTDIMLREKLVCLTHFCYFF